MDQFKIWFAETMEAILGRDYLTSSELFTFAAGLLIVFIVVAVLILGSISSRSVDADKMDNDKKADN